MIHTESDSVGASSKEQGSINFAPFVSISHARAQVYLIGKCRTARHLFHVPLSLFHMARVSPDQTELDQNPMAGQAVSLLLHAREQPVGFSRK